MASGAPVVSSDASCLPEVAGEAALLVDPSETRKLTEARRRACSGSNTGSGTPVRQLFAVEPLILTPSPRGEIITERVRKTFSSLVPGGVSCGGSVCKI